MTATGVQFTAFLNMISDRRLSVPSILFRVWMETDQIRMVTDSNILNICFSVFFHFPLSMIKTDRIRMKTYSDISDIYFSVF